MITKNKSLAVFNNLIQINLDRIAGYEKALNEVDEMDLDIKSIFTKMILESKQNKIELSNEVSALGGEPVNRSTLSGKIYLIWMDVKTAFSADDRQVMLDSCEYVEDVAIEAYEEALQTNAELTIGQLNLLTKQKAGIQLAHNRIKSYRDANEVVRVR